MGKEKAFGKLLSFDLKFVKEKEKKKENNCIYITYGYKCSINYWHDQKGNFQILQAAYLKCNLLESTTSERIIIVKKKLVTRVQFLNKAACISLHSNSIQNGMNIS